MVLGWKQPDKTGGAEITGYYVNYREIIDGVPGRWREANIKAISDEAYKVSMWPSVVDTLRSHTCAHMHMPRTLLMIHVISPVSFACSDMTFVTNI